MVLSYKAPGNGDWVKIPIVGPPTLTSPKISVEPEFLCCYQWCRAWSSLAIPWFGDSVDLRCHKSSRTTYYVDTNFQGLFAKIIYLLEFEACTIYFTEEVQLQDVYQLKDCAVTQNKTNAE